MFKIRDRDTGKYARGGQRDFTVWSKHGKVWSTIGALHLHLSQSRKYRFDAYAHADIIQYTNDGEQVLRSVHEEYEILSKNQAARKSADLSREQKNIERKERELLNKLMDKYPDEVKRRLYNV
jgi:hypothetical protein